MPTQRREDLLAPRADRQVFGIGDRRHAKRKGTTLARGGAARAPKVESARDTRSQVNQWQGRLLAASAREVPVAVVPPDPFALLGGEVLRALGERAGVSDLVGLIAL